MASISDRRPTSATPRLTSSTLGPPGVGQPLAIAAFRIEDVEIEVEIHAVRLQADCRVGIEQIVGMRHSPHANAIQQFRFGGVDVASADEEDALAGERVEAGHGAGQRLPALAGEHADAHAIEEARRGRLRSPPRDDRARVPSARDSGRNRTAPAGCRCLSRVKYASVSHGDDW